MYKNLFSAILSKPIKQQILYTHVVNGLRKQRNTTIKKQPVAEAPAEIVEKKSLSILIAEDNIVNQKIIIYMLTKLGYEADVASNGIEAINATSSKNYDLILMDVQMPEMDGLAATGIIRRKTGVQPFIVAMTANAMQGDKEECIVAGMNDYISKPITLNDLNILIEKYAEEVSRVNHKKSSTDL